MTKLTSEKQLMQSGLFPNKTAVVSYMILRLIAEKNEPMGCGILREELIPAGVKCSTATIGRYLRELDCLEYTVQRSNMGRVITPGGRAYLRNMDEKLERTKIQTELSKAVKVTEYGELIDLLDARKALETEAARLASMNATEADMERLMQSVTEHKDTVSHNEDPTDVALDFHAVVAEISHNRFINSILSMLIYEEKKIESRMEFLVTRERGRIYVKEHEKIAQAIQARDADLAARLMNEHIAVLGAAVAEQSGEG